MTRAHAAGRGRGGRGDESQDAAVLLPHLCCSAAQSRRKETWTRLPEDGRDDRGRRIARRRRRQQRAPDATHRSRGARDAALARSRRDASLARTSPQNASKSSRERPPASAPGSPAKSTSGPSSRAAAALPLVPPDKRWFRTDRIQPNDIFSETVTRGKAVRRGAILARARTRARFRLCSGRIMVERGRSWSWSSRTDRSMHLERVAADASPP